MKVIQKAKDNFGVQLNVEETGNANESDEIFKKETGNLLLGLEWK